MAIILIKVPFYITLLLLLLLFIIIIYNSIDNTVEIKKTSQYSSSNYCIILEVMTAITQ